MADSPQFEHLKDTARGFCTELLSENSRSLNPPDGITVDPAYLKGKRVVLWDIYGTLLAGRAVDLETSLSKPEAMLGSFNLTSQKFGFGKVLVDNAGSVDGAVWLRDRYLNGIERIHRKKKAEGYPSPEVRIEEIWSEIITELEALGYTAQDKERAFLPWKTALYYETAFQQAVFYRGAADVLLRLRDMGIMQGIVSNAQFYTPVLLELFLNQNPGGQKLRLADIFEPSLTVFSYLIGRSKPDPLIFAEVLKELDIRQIAGDDVIYVGNDMLNDIYTAASLGLDTMLFAGDSNSLELRLNDKRTVNFRPTSVITAHDQLPFLLAGGRAAENHTLHLGIWHHHLRPGGVSSVIRDTIEALGTHSGYSQVRAELFVDNSEPVDWLDRLNITDSLSVQLRIVPELAYDDRPAVDRADFMRRAEKHRDLLIELIDFGECDEANPYVLYAHNSALGKNPYASAGLRLLAEWAVGNNRPLLILNQTHDFAECHRPDRVLAWRAATTGIQDKELTGWEFPVSPNTIHASLTAADRQRLISTGIPPETAYILANSVRETVQPEQAVHPGLAVRLGGRPYLLAPQKVMRRKNTLEALLVLAAMRMAGPDPALVVTLPAASVADKKYEELVIRTVETTGLPAIIGLKRTFGREAPSFEEVVAGCRAFLTTSVMEGFGQSFLEGWVAGRPVLGRRLDEPCRDFEAAGVDLSHLYDCLLVDAEWLPGGLHCLKQAYRKALDDLRSCLGFPAQEQRTFEKDFTLFKTHEHGGRTLVDFADLSPVMQAGVVGLIAADSNAGREVLEFNPRLRLMASLFSGDSAELIRSNRELVLRSYGPRAKSATMSSIILAGTAAMSANHETENTVGVRSLENLLAETVSLQKTRLLLMDIPR
jgi:putative hydrolase of the HAD superfamily